VDAFNRGIIVVLAAICVILMAMVIFVTWAADAETIDRLGDLVRYLDDHTDNASKLILTLGASSLIVLSLIVIVAELTPSGPSPDIRLEGVTGATAVLSTEDINQRIEQEVTALPQIRESKASVTARDRGLAVALNLVIGPDANVPEATEEACRVTQETIEQKIGVALVGLPTVQIKFGPPEGEPAPASESAQQPPSPPLS
jgi:hypothetical protein